MSFPLAATLSPSAYWYLARGTGAVALVLLTVSVVLGILGSVRFTAPRWPRFAIDAVHRDVSLLVLVVLVIHIVTSVLDGFAPIRLFDGVIPFVTPYRPLWMGLGTVAFDLMLAIAITSLVRRRLGYQAWRAVHWLAYASWPVAVLHGLGTGSDVKQWWMLALTAACIVAVLVAVWTRIASTSGEYTGLRAPATALAVVTPIGLAVFTLAGPLQHGWARRAGTPQTLLGAPASSGSPGSASSSTSSAPPPASSGSSSALGGSWGASVNGTVTEGQAPGGAIVDLALQVNGRVRGRLRVRLGGVPIDGGGGLSMTGSQVDLAVAGQPSVLQGRIVSLRGEEFDARVSGAAGTTLDLHAQLQIDTNDNKVTGTLSGAPAGA
ncbi:MAG: ferric reductase-like transmembrane domain-containing protein [Solirubrobacterales bacterium]|nr:ferric reductase-like transmembrane domain-containing protein [Solirubrobacterales bacterium]